MKVLMIGETGKYASLVVPELKQRGVTIRALVRDKDKADAARQRGVDEAAIAPSISAIYVLVLLTVLQGALTARYFYVRLHSFQ